MSIIETGRTNERLRQADGNVLIGGEGNQRRYTFGNDVLTRTNETMFQRAATVEIRTRGPDGEV